MILGLRGMGVLPAGVPTTGATNGYVNLGGAGTGTMAAPVPYDVWTDINGNVVAVFTNGAWAPISIQGDSLSQYEQVLAAASVAYNSGAVSIAPSTSTSTTSTTSATVTAPTFSTGLELWGTPSTAFTTLTSLNWSTAFSTSANYPYLAGLLLPPIAAVGILVYAMSGSSSGKGRR